MKKEILTSSRKREHLDICNKKDVESGYSGFDDVRLVHCALPECNMDTIDTRVSFLGRTLDSPLFIAAMTGGHPDTKEVNAALAGAAEEFNIGMGVGSQRAALEDPKLEDSFAIVREMAPNAFICGNLGAVQLNEHGNEWADRAVEMIDAQALCIHLNFLQEAIQPEGDHNAGGCLEAIEELCSSARYPVIIKETGCGISNEIGKRLYAAGAAAIDIGGLGGTSWAAVEVHRASSPLQAELGRLFSDWGIPTAVSLHEVSRLGGAVIATGGIRTGLDIAKAIAMGATLGGMALPLLKLAMNGSEAVCNGIREFNTQLKAAMFLTGASTTRELTGIRKYVTGITREMLQE